MVSNREYFSRIGRACGYPKCCVDHFCGCMEVGVLPPTTVGSGPWSGTGFIPCPDHGKEIRETGLDSFIQRNVTPSRDARAGSFPNAENDFLVAVGHGIAA